VQDEQSRQIRYAAKHKQRYVTVGGISFQDVVYTSAFTDKMRMQIRKRATCLKVSLPTTRWQKTRAISGEGA
jgi:hypothetical protein